MRSLSKFLDWEGFWFTVRSGLGFSGFKFWGWGFRVLGFREFLETRVAWGHKGWEGLTFGICCRNAPYTLNLGAYMMELVRQAWV